MHRPYAGALPSEDPSDVCQAGVVAGDEHLGVGLDHVGGFVGTHGDGHVGVLHGEGAAEPAALLRAGQLDQVDALDRAQQLQRLVADPQHPQRVAGGVELIKRLFDKDWRAAITIIVAALIGGAGGLVFGANFLVGMVFGLATSGYITIAQNIAKK